MHRLLPSKRNVTKRKSVLQYLSQLNGTNWYLNCPLGLKKWGTNILIRSSVFYQFFIYHDHSEKKHRLGYSLLHFAATNLEMHEKYDATKSSREYCGATYCPWCGCIWKETSFPSPVNAIVQSRGLWGMRFLGTRLIACGGHAMIWLTTT